MFSAPDVDEIRQQIDRMTASVPADLTRTDIVTWFMINYLAGARDILASSLLGEIKPFEESADGESERQAVINAFNERISALAATSAWNGNDA